MYTARDKNLHFVYIWHTLKAYVVRVYGTRKSLRFVRIRHTLKAYVVRYTARAKSLYCVRAYVMR